MSTLIRELSDCHLEHFSDLYYYKSDKAISHIETLIPVLSTDENTVLIIAGDLATALRVNRIVTFIDLVVPRFKHVIYVLGNHEHYGLDISEAYDIISDALKNSNVDLTKITVIGNSPDKIKIDDVTFIGGTMWTDYNKGSESSAAIVQRYIHDHRAISNGSECFTVPDAIKIHESSLSIFDNWLTELAGEKVIVVTHHMPSYIATSPQYLTSEPAKTLCAAFASNLDEFILKHQPLAWFFGHTHTSYFGKIGETLLICNPLGYPREANMRTGEFNPSKLFII